MKAQSDLVALLNNRAENKQIDMRLLLVEDLVEGRKVFTSSFGLEDQIVTHVIAQSGLPIAMVTLDTGRLFPETYDLWAETEKRYGIRIKPFYPKAELIEEVVADHGINAFYSSFEKRKACCYVRKVEPLARALSGAKVWVTGLRAQQSSARGSTPFAEYDETRDLIKINPLHDWDSEHLIAQINAQSVPYNCLHDCGYLSIGCQPCTRAVRLGEDERAGRWWWEQSDQECGLHINAVSNDQVAENKAAAG
jgi:phosphoadenosine phosphosulfate reductase